MSGTTARSQTRGVVFVHSTPTALCPHIEWALQGVFGPHARPPATASRLQWIPQPAQPGTVRGELSWHGLAGTGAAVATRLRTFDGIRYEVTEDATPGHDGSRWSHTPALGIHHTATNAVGDAMIHENRLRALVEASRGDARALADGIDRLLGTAWDAELDVYRHAGEDAPVRHLHAAG
ncbi:Protein of unknown function [Kytococcus aerolatus]|uniref:DUF3145 domain-containing protein n=1 Tax=Kytococcus aerolatus TaxID=592308 RepID=A0A212U2V7_9MICO|nr:DUF3145 family protein [Kytococcus aerolatus]SNC72454.1 Protein of unknown function [Kytococcus aerolatus]